MKYITYINVLSKGIFTVLIFVLVRSADDYLLVPALNTLGAIIAGAISIYIVLYRDKVRFRMPGLASIIYFTRQSAPFFFSRATGVVVARSNTVLIGSFLGYTEVAYYDLAVKITELCKIPSNLINQTIYPRISVTKDMRMVLNITKYNLLLTVVLYMLIVIFSNPIISLLGGNEMLPAKYVVFLLNVTAPIAGISYFLGNTMLVVNNYYRAFNRSVIYEALLYVVLAFILIISKSYNLYTFTTIIILSTLFEMTYRYYFVKKYKII